MRLWVVFFFLFFSSAILAQGTDQQLAQHYYSNGDFEKALMYYEKLYDKDPSKINFTRLYDCYVQTKQPKDAEKLIKKQISSNKWEVEYKVLLGQFYEENNEIDKANKQYNSLIEDLNPDANSVIELFNAFKAKGRNDLALLTVEKGRKLLKKSYPLHFQFAEIYGAMGQTNKMIAEYLDLIDFHSSYASTVQTILSRQIDFSLDNSVEYDILKSALIDRVQKKPDEPVYAEMLIWLFIQKKNFEGALVQVQAMDKRTNEQGRSVFELGKICVENKEYATARKAFKYVINLGDDKPYYYFSENALLNTQFLEITTSRNFTKQEILTTIDDYQRAINRIGKNRRAVPLILELAHIEAFYGTKAEDAITLLNDGLSITGITDINKAELKMKLADIHVLHGDIWEASLLYMQVENDFKYEPIGHEAKFKNARIFYYDGEFDFAQSQLSVLKESTSKLIANDALNLSLMITDNFGLDSNYQAMTWFANADLLIEQHRYSEAFSLFDSIITNYPYHSLGDEILIKKAKAMELRGNWDAAINLYNELLKYHGEDILADDALFALANIYQNHLMDNEKAIEYYKRLLFEFKGSLFAEEVRLRLRILRGDSKIKSDEL